VLPHEHGNIAVSVSLLPVYRQTDALVARLTETLHARLATFYYTPDGKTTMDVIWDETLKELSFANVAGIVASMK
jgi:hypothetical protein